MGYLTVEQTEALVQLLSRTIDDDRYPLSPRVRVLKDILAKFRPEPEREASPPRRHTSRRAGGGMPDGGSIYSAGMVENSKIASAAASITTTQLAVRRIDAPLDHYRVLEG